VNGPVRIRRRDGYGDGIRFNGTNADVIAQAAGPLATHDGGRLVLHTPQGDMTPNLGDWVIQVDGEIYPISTKAFNRGWEVID
jgi:hypothetical protein